MNLYIYEIKKEIGDHKLNAMLGICCKKSVWVFDSIAYLLEWVAITGMFYINANYINSRLFSLFIFICGCVLLTAFKSKREKISKADFIKKVNEVLEEVDE